MSGFGEIGTLPVKLTERKALRAWNTMYALHSPEHGSTRYWEMGESGCNESD